MSVKEIRQKKLGKQSETGMEIGSLGLEKQVFVGLCQGSACGILKAETVDLG